jgi:hypothetical protein
MSNALVIASNATRTAERAFTAAASNTLRLALPAPPQSSATINAQPLDMASSIVAQMQASVAFKANLAVYRTANAMYRTMLRAIAA